MSTIQKAARSGNLGLSQCSLDILCQNPAGSWSLRLPADLKAYQGELEELLGKVFSSRQYLDENLPLAQQMSLNWCMSKCREVGISFEDSVLSKTNSNSVLG